MSDYTIIVLWILAVSWLGERPHYKFHPDQSKCIVVMTTHKLRGHWGGGQNRLSIMATGYVILGEKCWKILTCQTFYVMVMRCPRRQIADLWLHHTTWGEDTFVSEVTPKGAKLSGYTVKQPSLTKLLNLWFYLFIYLFIYIHYTTLVKITISSSQICKNQQCVITIISGPLRDLLEWCRCILGKWITGATASTTNHVLFFLLRRFDASLDRLDPLYLGHLHPTWTAKK